MSAVRELLPAEGNEEGATRLASNKKIKEFSDRIMKKMAARDQLNADIKGEYDLADDNGIDRKALRATISHKRGQNASDDHKTTVNAYLKALGELPLFAIGTMN